MLQKSNIEEAASMVDLEVSIANVLSIGRYIIQSICFRRGSRVNAVHLREKYNIF